MGRARQAQAKVAVSRTRQRPRAKAPAPEFLLARAAHPPTLPRAEVSELAHIGSLNAADKEASSLEGLGVSVSRDPELWEEIARLGGGRWWSLRNNKGVFVDYHQLDESTREAVSAWGVEQGLVERQRMYFVESYDDELEDMVYSTHDQREYALEEIEDMELEAEALSTREVVRATASMLKIMGMGDSGDAFDHLLGLYVSTHYPEIDGIWWEDSYGFLSAPRGVIFPHRVCAWQASAWKSKNVLKEG